ncbi:hypothetical protein [Novosphingobium sp. KA1]|uniref:hypothetical protein n=1 Tax=Novosphingobium sp. (strain KA1) TaxID=164608 RepID=UPI001AF31AEB|nr:hypothetical protein [Novosphingobium sp. KA1]QSR19506.1 hypothetical protein CA833_20290 [Novosphingobium sp. KA1]
MTRRDNHILILIDAQSSSCLSRYIPAPFGARNDLHPILHLASFWSPERDSLAEVHQRQRRMRQHAGGRTLTGEIPEITLLAAMPEQPHTRRLIPVFRQWMDDHGVPNEIVEYQPRFFKQWARYGSLLEACLTNSTLSSIAFGLHSCSLGLATKSVLSSRRCAVMFQADRRAYPKSWRWSA